MSFKQIFAFLLCAVLLTGAVPAFAASATIEIPSSSSAVSAPCNIRVLNGHLHLVSNFQTISSFDLRNTEITLLEQDGRLAVQFEEKGAAGATVLPLASENNAALGPEPVSGDTCRKSLGGAQRCWLTTVQQRLILSPPP